MKEISNFNELEATEVVSTGLQKGVYVARILRVIDREDKEYLEVWLDIAKGPQTGYFTKLYEADTNPEKTWNNQGIWRASYKDTATKFFKAFITAVEKSNLNYRWDWNEQSLVNKMCVAVYGEEEYLSKDNEVKISTKIREIRSTEALQKGEIKIPELKKLRVQPISAQPVVEISDKDMPF